MPAGRFTILFIHIHNKCFESARRRNPSSLSLPTESWNFPHRGILLCLGNRKGYCLQCFDTVGLASGRTSGL